MKAAQLLPYLLCLMLTPLAIAAPVYTYKDADGATVFTDQAHPGAKRIELAPSNRVSVPSAPTHRPTKAAPPVQVARYQMLRILVPLPDAGMQQDDGALIVTLTSDPPLFEGHYYRVLMDDTVVGDPSRSPVFAVPNVDRGEHKLAAEIIDDRGHIIERTPAQIFFMQRISLTQKRRVHPCEEADYGVRPECPLADKPVDD